MENKEILVAGIIFACIGLAIFLYIIYKMKE